MLPAQFVQLVIIAPTTQMHQQCYALLISIVLQEVHPQYLVQVEPLVLLVPSLQVGITTQSAQLLLQLPCVRQDFIVLRDQIIQQQNVLLAIFALMEQEIIYPTSVLLEIIALYKVQTIQLAQHKLLAQRATIVPPQLLP